MGTLYENIKLLCEEHGIKASNFGLVITGSKSFMSELKSGRKKGVNAETAQKIADYFNVSVDRVLYGKDAEKEKKPATEVTGEMDAIRREIVDRLVKLSPQEIIKVAAYIDGIIAAKGD